MLGIVVVGLQCYCLKCVGNSLIQLRLVFSVYALRNVGILLFQQFFVGIHPLCRQNFLSAFSCKRVFRGLHVVFFIHKVRRYKQCKKFAYVKCFMDVFLKIFTGRQKLVIPNRYISIHWILMNLFHQLVCKVSIFFSITEKDIRIKRFANAIYRSVVEQN